MAQLPVNGILASQAHSISIHEFASSIAALLDAADRDFDKDLPAAKASIAKASLLLRIEMGRGETQSANDPSHGGLTGWQCQRIRAYVDSHLDQHIQISDLCAVARRSEGHFYRIFKRTFGETPHSYIVGRRLERAKQLMIDTDVFLTEIGPFLRFRRPGSPVQAVPRKVRSEPLSLAQGPPGAAGPRGARSA